MDRFEECWQGFWDWCQDEAKLLRQTKCVLRRRPAVAVVRFPDGRKERLNKLLQVWVVRWREYVEIMVEDPSPELIRRGEDAVWNEVLTLVQMAPPAKEQPPQQ